MSIRSSGDSCGTGRLICRMGYRVRWSEGGSGEDRLGGSKLTDQFLKRSDGGAAQRAPRGGETMIGDRRVFVVLPMKPCLMRRENRALQPGKVKPLCVAGALMLQPK